ncbi:MAG TPA: glycosyltransferase [Flavipsychrobacter sp.]|nr:glycosyltransferase [Flavipsychrobacter sp.]
MKKILLIGSELGKGGAERSISLLSYYLEQMQYDITLCILSGKDREKFYRTCEKVVFVDPPEYSGTWGKIKAWRYRINKIKSLKEGVDVSISFLEGPDYVNAMTKGKEKIVLSIRGSKVHDKEIKGKMGKVRKKVLIPMLYKRADEIVCVTQTLSNELQQHFGISPKRLKTIYNFYETDRIINLSNEALNEEEAKIFSKPVIITSGRLHVAKEQDKLIRILQRIKQTTEARLMILGDGELKEALIKLSDKLGLKVCDWQKEQRYEDADVYFMGFQSNAFKFYRHSTLFALASSWEGFPNVLAEALICNIPSVTTDCYTGPREILNVPKLEETPVQKAVRTPVGSLLPLLDVIDESRMHEWIQEILYWLQTPPPPKEAFEVLTQRFTLEAMLQQWKDVIEN